jgi:hypothetical protein
MEKLYNEKCVLSRSLSVIGGSGKKEGKGEVRCEVWVVWG